MTSRFVPKLPPMPDRPKLGAGISRPMPKEKTRRFSLLVTFPKAMPMKVTITAATKAKAVMYCKNRWPDCQVKARK